MGNDRGMFPTLREAGAWPAVLGLIAMMTFASPVQSREAVSGDPVAVHVGAKVVGTTPSMIGYNMVVEDLPGSDVSFWVEYSGMNAVRHWWPLNTWPEAPARWTRGGNTLEHFEAERARLRAAPLAEDWSGQEKAVAEDFGGVVPGMTGHAFMLSEMRRLGLEILCPLTVGPWNVYSAKRYPFWTTEGGPDWESRWAYWHGVYRSAFYLARYYDVERFQLFNEPDHPNAKPMTQDDFLARLQIGSDAVRAAVDDVNRLFGKKLRSIISAPVTAGIDVYRARPERTDDRDHKRGWGELAVAALDVPFAGQGEPRRPLFDQYAFQNYTRYPGEIARLGGELKRELEKDRSGAGMPLIISETNVSTAANFRKTDKTMDTPENYAGFGAIAIAYLKLGMEEFYVFRFTQTSNMLDGSVKKNGMHVIDNDDPLKRILRSTKGAEVARLFAHALGGGRERMAPAEGLPEGVSLMTARDGATGEVHGLLANVGPAKVLELDFSDWELAEGLGWSVEEVSERAHGAITAEGRLGGDRSIRLEVPANSNLAICIGKAVTAMEEADAEEVTLAGEGGRWALVDVAARAGSRLELAVVPAGVEKRIVRVWLENATGEKLRLCGHFVLGGAETQRLALRAGEVRAGNFIRIERELATDAALPAGIGLRVR